MSKTKENTLIALIQKSAEELKGLDIQVIDVKGKASFTDSMVIVTGTSTRHAKSIAQAIIDESKQQGFKPVGMEGEEDGEWVLVDLGDVVAHIMIQESRDFYQIEDLWKLERK